MRGLNPPLTARHEGSAAGLAAMAQEGVGENAGRHGLDHGNGANPHARIMTALGA